MSTCPICDTKMCPGSKSHTIAWAQIYLSKSEGLSSVLWPQPASQRHVSTEGPISQNEKLEHAEVRDLQHSRNRKKTGRLLLCRVLSHSCSNAITNTLPSSLDQKGEWQENDVRHWKNAYSPNTSSELRTERKRKSNPRWNPGNEWHWELDLTCTSVRLKWLRNTLNQGIELELVNVPAPCTNLHDLTLHAAAQPELSQAAKVLRSLNSSRGRAGPHQAQNYNWLTQRVGEHCDLPLNALQATTKPIYQYGNG